MPTPPEVFCIKTIVLLFFSLLVSICVQIMLSFLTMNLLMFKGVAKFFQRDLNSESPF